VGRRRGFHEGGQVSDMIKRGGHESNLSHPITAL
jgi:hypothetical protein